MARPSNTTIRLRRAAGVNAFGEYGTLEGLVRHLIASDQLQRSSQVDGRYVFLLHERAERVGGVLLNLVVYTPDEANQVIPDPRRARPADISTYPPPRDAHYVQGSLNYLLDGDNLYCARSGFRSESALQAFIWQASRELGIEPDVYQFALEDRVDVDALQRLQQEGVKSLSFDGVASEIAVAEADRGSLAEGFLGSVVDQAKSLLGWGVGAPMPDDSMKVHVTLALDQRRARLEVDPFVYELARRTIEDDEEGFKIVTARGREVTADKIKFTRLVPLPRTGNHPQHQAAWDALLAFREELD